VERLRQVVDDMGIGQLEQMCAEALRRDDVLPQLRHEEAGLLSVMESMRAEVQHLDVLRSQANAIRTEVQHLQAQQDAMAATLREAERLDTAMGQLRIEYAELSRTLIKKRETVLLQEAGVYQYRHPLDDAIA
jgi:hypothetical protein